MKHHKFVPTDNMIEDEKATELSDGRLFGYEINFNVSFYKDVKI